MAFTTIEEREIVFHNYCNWTFFMDTCQEYGEIRRVKLILMLPWQIPSFPQLPCDGCPPDRPKHCTGAQQFSGWTHPAELAPGFSAAAGWLDCTGTPAPLEYWSYTESSSSSSGPGVGQGWGHRGRHRKVYEVWRATTWWSYRSKNLDLIDLSITLIKPHRVKT